MDWRIILIISATTFIVEAAPWPKGRGVKNVAQGVTSNNEATNQAGLANDATFVERFNAGFTGIPSTIPTPRPIQNVNINNAALRNIMFIPNIVLNNDGTVDMSVFKPIPIMATGLDNKPERSNANGNAGNMNLNSDNRRILFSTNGRLNANSNMVSVSNSVNNNIGSENIQGQRNQGQNTNMNVFGTNSGGVMLNNANNQNMNVLRPDSVSNSNMSPNGVNANNQAALVSNSNTQTVSELRPDQAPNSYMPSIGTNVNNVARLLSNANGQNVTKSNTNTLQMIVNRNNGAAFLVNNANSQNITAVRPDTITNTNMLQMIGNRNNGVLTTFRNSNSQNIPMFIPDSVNSNRLSPSIIKRLQEMLTNQKNENKGKNSFDSSGSQTSLNVMTNGLNGNNGAAMLNRANNQNVPVSGQNLGSDSGIVRQSGSGNNQAVNLQTTNVNSGDNAVLRPDLVTNSNNRQMIVNGNGAATLLNSTSNKILNTFRPNLINNMMQMKDNGNNGMTKLVPNRNGQIMSDSNTNTLHMNENANNGTTTFLNSIGNKNVPVLKPDAVTNSNMLPVIMNRLQIMINQQKNKGQNVRNANQLGSNMNKAVNNKLQVSSSMVVGTRNIQNGPARQDQTDNINNQQSNVLVQNAINRNVMANIPNVQNSQFHNARSQNNNNINLVSDNGNINFGIGNQQTLSRLNGNQNRVSSLAGNQRVAHVIRNNNGEVQMIMMAPKSKNDNVKNNNKGVVNIIPGNSQSLNNVLSGNDQSNNVISFINAMIQNRNAQTIRSNQLVNSLAGNDHMNVPLGVNNNNLNDLKSQNGQNGKTIGKNGQQNVDFQNTMTTPAAKSNISNNGSGQKQNAAGVDCDVVKGPAITGDGNSVTASSSSSNSGDNYR